MSPSFERLLRRAAWLGQEGPDAPIASFTSVFLAFFASDDEFSRWVQDKASWVGPTLEDVIRQWNATSRRPGRDLALVAAARQRSDEELAVMPVMKTMSIEGILIAARELLHQVGGHELDVRHVFAAYLYLLHGHADDLAAWRLDREAWATRFRCYVTEGWPDEAAGWREVHDAAFPRPFSVGVTAALRWASALATLHAPAASDLDSGLVLAGMLHDGIRNHDPVTTAHLVKHLGGVDK